MLKAARHLCSRACAPHASTDAQSFATAHVVRYQALLRTQVSESAKLQSQTSSLMRAMDAFNEAIMLVDMDLARWTIMFTNDAWLRIMSARLAPCMLWGWRGNRSCMRRSDACSGNSNLLGQALLGVLKVDYTIFCS